MYKYVFRVQQALYRQKQLDKVHFHSSEYCNNSNVEKNPKYSVSFKPKKIQKRKQLISSRKQTVVYIYSLLWNRLLSPLVEFVPGVKKVHHLSKLSDFRSHNGFLGKTEVESKTEGKTVSKCLEEPQAITTKKHLEVEDCIIKDPFDVVINKSTNSKGSVRISTINKRNHSHSKGKYKATYQSQSKAKSILYKLLVKRLVDPKIENFIPSESQLSELCDFRSYKEGHAQCGYGINEMPSSNSHVTHKLTDSGVQSKIVQTKPVFNAAVKKSAPVEHISKLSHLAVNTQMANKVSKTNSRVNQGNVAKMTSEIKKTGKKNENQKISIVKAPKEDIKKPPLGVGPPLPKLEKKTEVKDVVANKSQRFSGNATPEVEIKELLIESKTDDNKKPANKCNLTKNNVAMKSEEPQRELLASQSLHETINHEETMSTSKNSDENKNLTENQSATVETSQGSPNQSHIENNISKAPNLLLREQTELVDKDNEINTAIEQNATKPIKQVSNIKLKAIDKIKGNTVRSEILNGKTLSKSSNEVKISQEKEVKLNLNGEESVKSTGETLLNIQEDLSLQSKINDREINNRQLVDSSIVKSKNKPINKEVNKKNHKYFNNYQKSSRFSGPGHMLKSRTHRLQNDIDSKSNDNKKSKSSTDEMSLKEKPSTLSLNTTQLVSLDKSGEGCVVKTGNNLINLNDVVSAENSNKGKSKINVMGNIQKSQNLNNSHAENASPKSWSRAKENVVANYDFKDSTTIKNEGVTIPPLNNVSEENNNTLLVNNSKRPVSSSSSSNIKSKKTPVLKTISLENVVPNDKLESKMDHTLKSLELKEKNSNISRVDKHQSLEISEKSPKYEIRQHCDIESDKSNGIGKTRPKNSHKEKIEEKVRVLREIKKEKIMELKKKDNTKMKQMKGNVQEESKLHVLKEKTVYTLNDLEKNKESCKDNMKNSIVIKTNLKTENIVNDSTLKAVNSETGKASQKNSSVELKLNAAGTSQREEESSQLSSSKKLQRHKNSEQNKENNSVVLKNSTDKTMITSYLKPTIKRSNVKEYNESMPREKDSKFIRNTQQKLENKLNLSAKTKHQNRSKSSTTEAERIIKHDKTLNANSNTPVNNLQKALSSSNMKSYEEENIKYFTDAENDSFRKKVNSINQSNDGKRLFKSKLAEKRDHLIEKEQFKPKMSQLLNNQSTTGLKEKTETRNTTVFKNQEIVKQQSNQSVSEITNKVKIENKPPIRNNRIRASLNINKNSKLTNSVKATEPTERNSVNIKKDNIKPAEHWQDQTSARLRNVANTPFIPSSKKELNSDKYQKTSFTEAQKNNQLKNNKSNVLNQKALNFNEKSGIKFADKSKIFRKLVNKHSSDK